MRRFESSRPSQGEQAVLFEKKGPKNFCRFGADNKELAAHPPPVFLLRSKRINHTHVTPAPTPEPDQDRVERQLGLCRHLTDMAMQLAEASHAQALADLTTTEPAASRPNPTAATLFLKFSDAARQAMMLESRIAAARHASPKPREDARRPPLRKILHGAATTRPDGPNFKRLAYERLDTELALDPRATPADILATLCETLGLEIPPDLFAEHFSGQAWPTLRPAQKAPRPPAANAFTPGPSLWATVAQEIQQDPSRRT